MRGGGRRRGGASSGRRGGGGAAGKGGGGAGFEVVRVGGGAASGGDSGDGVPQQEGHQRKRPRADGADAALGQGVGAKRGGKAKRAGDRVGKGGVNTLSNAHKAAQRTASKAAELWFRKCGFGPELFRQYYDAVLGDAADAAAMRECMRTPLPLTFRLCRAAPGAAEAAAALERALVEQGLAERVGALDCGGDDGPFAGGAWEAAGGAAARKRRADRSSVEEALLRALEGATGAAAAARQETVSMLPVLALQPRAGEAVADLCAAPGSKTMMILEAVGEHGFVVANDADPRRLRTLTDCLTRHGRRAPSAPARCCALAAVNHGGQAVPLPQKPFGRCGAGRSTTRVGFDRVLADVPCSGDGTVRKDSSVLPRWTPGVGNALHATQLAIALRGVELLRVGGTMVYSTCSLNPIEDEAVVAEVLRRARGAVKVAAWPAGVADGFVRRPGLTTWRVADHAIDDDEEEASLRWYETRADAKAAGMRPAPQRSMFAPAKLSDGMRTQLQRCSRIAPHDNNSGGFFVAVLKKVAEWRQDDDTAEGECARRARRSPAGPGARSRVRTGCGLECALYVRHGALTRRTVLRPSLAPLLGATFTPRAHSAVSTTEKDALRDAGLPERTQLLRDDCSGNVRAVARGVRAFGTGALNLAWSGCAVTEDGAVVREAIEHLREHACADAA